MVWVSRDFLAWITWLRYLALLLQYVFFFVFPFLRFRPSNSEVLWLEVSAKDLVEIFCSEALWKLHPVHNTGASSSGSVSKSKKFWHKSLGLSWDY